MRSDFVEQVSKAIELNDAAALRALAGDLHESDTGDLIDALDHDLRPRFVELLGREFDFTALTEVDDAVREDILDELPPKTVAEGVRDLDSDDAAYILEDLPKDEQAEILEQLPQPGARRTQAHPGLSGKLRRPPHADRVHRGPAVMDGRRSHRLHARDRRPAGPFLRALRDRSASRSCLARWRSISCCETSGRGRSPI